MVNNFSELKRNKPKIKKNVYQIINGLWCGDINSALDYNYLNNKSINCIINCCENPKLINTKNMYYPPSIKYRVCKDLYKDINWTVDYIENGILNDENILLFCDTGIQRSPTIVLAYLIKFAKINIKTAHMFMKSKNENIFIPNIKYIDLLYSFEKINK